RRQRQGLADETALDPEQQQLVEVETVTVSLARCPVQRRGAVVRREHVDEARSVGSVRLLGKPSQKSKDRVAPAVGAGHDAVSGHVPDGILGEDVTQAEAVLSLERVEQPPDQRFVPISLRPPHRYSRPRVSSQRAISPSTCRRWASVKEKRSSTRLASSGSSLATAASRCSRRGVDWRS